MSQRQANLPLGIMGAGLGAIIGAMLFFTLTRAGLYALALPGAAVGLTCGWLSGGRSNVLGVVCCVTAAILGVVIEWRFAPFRKDDSFRYFVTHVHLLSGGTQIMILLGAAFGFWFGIGRDRDIGFAERPAAPPHAAGADEENPQAPGRHDAD